MIVLMFALLCTAKNSGSILHGTSIKYFVTESVQHHAMKQRWQCNADCTNNQRFSYQLMVLPCISEIGHMKAAGPQYKLRYRTAFAIEHLPRITLEGIRCKIFGAKSTFHGKGYGY